MNAVEGREAKAGKRADNCGVCKGMLGQKFPTPKKEIFYQLIRVFVYDIPLNPLGISAGFPEVADNAIGSS
jgi:hypothetical protein